MNTPFWTWIWTRCVPKIRDTTGSAYPGPSHHHDLGYPSTLQRFDDGRQGRVRHTVSEKKLHKTSKLLLNHRKTYFNQIIFHASLTAVRSNFAHTIIPRRRVLWRNNVCWSHWLSNIIATSHEQIGISSQRQLECFLNSLFRVTSKLYQSSALLAILGESAGEPWTF